ncbi:MAG: hypothetical protein M1831_005857 [Alyxoria varia]|nr:MAG: hypothetical protein M1831_005857 [Alyxoria varia]
MTEIVSCLKRQAALEPIKRSHYLIRTPKFEQSLATLAVAMDATTLQATGTAALCAVIAIPLLINPAGTASVASGQNGDTSSTATFFLRLLSVLLLTIATLTLFLAGVVPPSRMKKQSPTNTDPLAPGSTSDKSQGDTDTNPTYNTVAPSFTAALTALSPLALTLPTTTALFIHSYTYSEQSSLRSSSPNSGGATFLNGVNMFAAGALAALGVWAGVFGGGERWEDRRRRRSGWLFPDQGKRARKMEKRELKFRRMENKAKR